jgi:carboxymethylenebutenolidase
MNEQQPSDPGLASAQDSLRDLWEEHLRHEFSTRNAEATLSTMVPEACVNHIPVLTGGVGREGLRVFYSKRFIPQMPPDTKIIRYHGRWAASN